MKSNIPFRFISTLEFLSFIQFIIGFEIKLTIDCVCFINLRINFDQFQIFSLIDSFPMEIFIRLGQLLKNCIILFDMETRFNKFYTFLKKLFSIIFIQIIMKDRITNGGSPHYWSKNLFASWHIPTEISHHSILLNEAIRQLIYLIS